jgi:hypothetical protein
MLRLFCNWVAHTEITKSDTGLGVLAVINDTLVNIKNSMNMDEMRVKISQAIGFSVLRKELKMFFEYIKIENLLVSDNKAWFVFLGNLIEIIRDTPLSFPPLSKLNKTQQKIYNQIAENPIKPGAGVVSIKISLVKYPPPTDETMCLIAKTEDTTSIIIPLLIDVRL